MGDATQDLQAQLRALQLEIRASDERAVQAQAAQAQAQAQVAQAQAQAAQAQAEVQAREKEKALAALSHWRKRCASSRRCERRRKSLSRRLGSLRWAALTVSKQFRPN
jgi:hypothetical protein